jgi:hypothetical protein
LSWFRNATHQPDPPAVRLVTEGIRRQPTLGREREAVMSNNNGTGFWVVVALIVALSAAALIDAAVRFASRKIRRLATASAPPSRGYCVEDAGA